MFLGDGDRSCPGVDAVKADAADRNGNTLITLRGDGAGPQSPESAVEKAYTAVSWNAPTSELVKRLEWAPT